MLLQLWMLPKCQMAPTLSACFSTSCSILQSSTTPWVLMLPSPTSSCTKRLSCLILPLTTGPPGPPLTQAVPRKTAWEQQRPGQCCRLTRPGASTSPLGSPMASAARRQRRERRFRRYLSAGRLVRAQALLQRHPGLDVDAGQPPPLHRACARHDAPALCLLLRLGADPARQDRHGDTALHAAARQGPDAYTDFFLPLLSRCPSAMGIKNKDGETPGQILGWGPPWDSAEEDDDDEASREQEWRRKLQGELEDEWQEVIGRFEDDASHETQEPESFSAWSDRLAREHAQKRQRQQREAQGTCRPQRAEGSSSSWRQQEEEQRLFRERARVKEEELRASRASRDPGPETARARPRAEHTRGVGRGSLWRFGDVPWPCPGGGDPEAMAAALVARGPPLEEQGALRRYLRVQQVRWHPDRFLQRFRNQIETWELGRVMGAVTALSQALNRHAEALK
ncbi:NF-kappa-B inhibitor-like protein 1 isoform X2 [Dasypus novemcinctus]|uniref:NF-kappa-B inhibitor-like protein 1 isoform X2 n=1 Tax=Dasypus novemcinctus TaxID=9361 RepID=UPI00265D6E74|nr:NF-kappa-B inhibitor-like protein 1 isoform X2 [Dasypus novemcinctus]